MAALLDTSVVIDWDDPRVVASLPEEVLVSVITLAELSAGPHLATTAAEKARRQTRLQQVEAKFEPIVFDAAAARAYGQVVAAIASKRRSHRRRDGDLMIASIALANGVSLLTANPADFLGLEGLIEITGI